MQDTRDMKMTSPRMARHVLVVGDQKQVCPVAVGVSENMIRDLKSSLLASRHPYVEQLLPGRSIFDLAQTVRVLLLSKVPLAFL